MGNPVKILPSYTYEDYKIWEGKLEFIHGILYAISSKPMPKHQRIAGNLFAEFRNPLKNCKKCVVYEPIDYKISDDAIIQPDLLIVCKEITNRNFVDFAPKLVV